MLFKLTCKRSGGLKFQECKSVETFVLKSETYTRNLNTDQSFIAVTEKMFLQVPSILYNSIFSIVCHLGGLCMINCLLAKTQDY